MSTVPVFPTPEERSLSGSQLKFTYGRAKAKFLIPLMMKNENSIEKYVSKFQGGKREQRKPCLISSTFTDGSKSGHALSTYASNLIMDKKLQPDPGYQQSQKYYVKYNSLKDQQTNSRMEILDRVSLQYKCLKNNLEQKRESNFQKKALLKEKRKGFSEGKGQSHIENLHDEMKKIKVEQNGKTYFANLYMLKKTRDKIKQELDEALFKKNQQSSSMCVFVPETKNHHEYQRFINNQKKKKIDEKKNKFLRNKGLHWNVYYEMLALNENERKNLKKSNLNFFYDFNIEK